MSLRNTVNANNIFQMMGKSYYFYDISEYHEQLRNIGKKQVSSCVFHISGQVELGLSSYSDTDNIEYHLLENLIIL